MSYDLKFIDLFCGIGGFRQALEPRGHKCVLSSDWDPHAQAVYRQNYGDVPLGDLTELAQRDIPPHDLLCGGFPASHLAYRETKKVLLIPVVHCYITFYTLPSCVNQGFCYWKMFAITFHTMEAGQWRSPWSFWIRLVIRYFFKP